MQVRHVIGGIARVLLLRLRQAAPDVRLRRIYLDGFDEEAAGAERLLEYCRANNFVLNGDYLCEEMTELNLFDNSKRNMFLRLQVPVIFTKN